MRVRLEDRIAARWIFAYGSLIWDPGFDYDERCPVRIHGFHRAFCIRSTRYRGTESAPGIVLGLDRGGSCHGLAYRIAGISTRDVVEQIYRREMGNYSYLPRMIPIKLSDGRHIEALTFVARRVSPGYESLDDAELMRRLRNSRGVRGSNREYAINTWTSLKAMNIVDRRLAGIVNALAAVSD